MSIEFHFIKLSKDIENMLNKEFRYEDRISVIKHGNSWTLNTILNDNKSSEDLFDENAAKELILQISKSSFYANKYIRASDQELVNNILASIV